MGTKMYITEKSFELLLKIYKTERRNTLQKMKR